MTEDRGLRFPSLCFDGQHQCLSTYGSVESQV